MQLHYLAYAALPAWVAEAQVGPGAPAGQIAGAALGLTGNLLGAFVPASQIAQAQLPRIDARLIAQANKQMLDAGPSELCVQSLARMRGQWQRSAAVIDRLNAASRGSQLEPVVGVAVRAMQNPSSVITGGVRSRQRISESDQKSFEESSSAIGQAMAAISQIEQINAGQSFARGGVDPQPQPGQAQGQQQAQNPQQQLQQLAPQVQAQQPQQGPQQLPQSQGQGQAQRPFLTDRNLQALTSAASLTLSDLRNAQFATFGACGPNIGATIQGPEEARGAGIPGSLIKVACRI